MPEHNKVNILYLFPGPVYRPDLPNFKDRFEMLSERFEGEIYSWTTDQRFKEFRVGDFLFRGCVCGSAGFLQKIRLACHILKWGWFVRKKADVIICFDPMFTGVLAVFLKWISRAKVIIEINSSVLGGAPRFECAGHLGRIKYFIYRNLSVFSLNFADGIRVLTEFSRQQVLSQFAEKKIFCFHEYVPTHFFSSEDILDGQYILTVGFPFYRKGVDVLVKAFETIAQQFPRIQLRCVGHRLGEDAKRYLADGWYDRVSFIKPVFYDELRPHFLNCTCFVLASREEGMGCVLLEAMASGKPVIGSRVGGIPALVEDGRNGFLFESGNSDDLADKLQRLLSEPDLAKRMGEESRRIVEEKFSSEKYIKNFEMMIDEITI